MSASDHDATAELIERLGILVNDPDREKYATSLASDSLVMQAEAAIVRASVTLTALVEAQGEARAKLQMAALAAVEEAERAAADVRASIRKDRAGAGQTPERD